MEYGITLSPPDETVRQSGQMQLCIRSIRQAINAAIGEKPVDTATVILPSVRGS